MQWWDSVLAVVRDAFTSAIFGDVGLRLLAAAGIMLGAVATGLIGRTIILRVVGRIITGLKRRSDLEDTQALLSSPLAAVRIVQRTRTLGSVMTNALSVVVSIVAVLALVNLLAPGALASFTLISAALGAGLGFGAQNIVRDVLAGIFMVLEDQLGVGDVVNLGDVTGTVESVTIRVTRVRDINGTLWWVRNGEIARVANQSQGWSRAMVTLRVPTNTDVARLSESLIEHVEAYLAAAERAHLVLEKPEVWGPENLDASGIELCVVVKTRAAAKDDLARGLRIAVIDALGAFGLDLVPSSTVRILGSPAS